ncbi:PREDICTED: CCA tRNA nucleotidyltransferase 1, mitochondrial isoform X2 [Ceratosolen solmsi marchali]|nr:PREDICTED: CCA tRNA nucleotidyltransferase 1, mitochondrial isoform X2 [Ceratosolen solmsi marchali]
MSNKNLLHRSDPVIKILDTPEFKSLFTPELIHLSNIFKKYNFELRIAGGAVRDILMNINPKDLDFATNATPTEMKDIFTNEDIRMINGNGEKHGTITSRINNKQNFEITTLRVDVVTNGRHADVEFTTDWLLDASRRDLTINSMFLDLNGKVYDYFYGYEDLTKRNVIFVGDPAERICEDFLRILRYFRFYGRISDVGDNFDVRTIQAIKDNVSGLEIISGERIWHEWSMILEGKFCREITRKILECGCGKYMGIPKNPNYDEFDKVCLNAEKNNVKLRPISYATALLNNEDEVLDLTMRLKFTKYDRLLALSIVEYRENELDENSLKFYQKLILKSIYKVSDAKEYVCEFLRYKGAMDLLEKMKKFNTNFPVRGSELLPFVNDKRIMQHVINELKDVWVDNDCEISLTEMKDVIPSIVEKVKNERKYMDNSFKNNRKKKFRKY